MVWATAGTGPAKLTATAGAQPVINDSWGSMSGIGFHQQAEAPHARPGHFNDPDMLVVGKVGWGDAQHNTKLTPDE